MLNSKVWIVDIETYNAANFDGVHLLGDTELGAYDEDGTLKKPSFVLSAALVTMGSIRTTAAARP
jgi:hypothetical protein